MDRAEGSRLSGLLAALTDDELAALVPPGSGTAGSWARSGTIVVDGTTLFAKRVPVTDLEVARWPSTANHHDLPLRYQYGVGSAGFGAAREARTWAQASRRVDAGATDGFTRLLHERLVSRREGEWSLPLERERYLDRWGHDEHIAGFVDARAAATHDLWLVGEHLPHTLSTWLPAHQDRVDDVVDRLLDVLAVLREDGIVHFDAHLANVVVDHDGERTCLVDFGLASSPDLDLGPAERDFVAAHRHYDLGEVLFSLSLPLGAGYRGLDETDRERARRCCGLPDEPDPSSLLAGLVDHAGRLADEGLVDLHPRYVDALARYRQVVLYVDGVLAGVVRGDGRPAYDDAELVARLAACGVATSD